MPLTPEEIAQLSRQPPQSATAGFRAATTAKQPKAPPQAEEEEDDGSGLGSQFASGFRFVVRKPARDVLGKTAQNLLSGERALNTVGGLAGNDRLGTEIGEALGSVPYAGTVLRHGFDVLAAPATIATAGFGGAAASGLSKVAAGGVRGFTARGAAKVIEPVARGNVAQRLAAETAFGTGAMTLQGEVVERLPEETPGGISFALQLAAGAVGGVGALKATRSASRSLVGAPPIVVRPGVEVQQETADRLGRTLTLDEMVPNTSVDEALSDRSAMREFRRAYGDDEGVMGKIARLIHPKDPDAATIVAKGAKREAAHNSWMAARMPNVIRANKVLKKLGLDKDGTIGVPRVGRTFTVSQEVLDAVDELVSPLREQAKWEMNIGINRKEIIGDERRDAVKREIVPGGVKVTVPENILLGDRMMLGDFIEVITGEPYFPREVRELSGIGEIRQRIDPRRLRVSSPSNPEYTALMEENMAKGTKYVPSAVQLVHDRLVAGGRLANRKWLANESERFGRTPDDFLSQHYPGLKEQNVVLQRALRNTRLRLARTITRRAEQTRGVRRVERARLEAAQARGTLSAAQKEQLAIVERVDRISGEAQASMLEDAPTVGDIFERIGDASRNMSRIEKMADSAYAAKVLSDVEVAKLREDIVRLRDLSDETTTKLRSARDRATHVGPGEAVIHAFGGQRFFPEAFAKAMSNAVSPDQNPALGKLLSVNNLLRSFTAALDMSAAGINGLLVAGTHPIGFGKALLTSTYSLFDENVYHGYISKNRGELDNFIRLNGAWHAPDYAGEFMQPSGLTRLPGIGKAFSLSNTAFSRTGNMMRLEMFKAELEVRGLLQTAGAVTRSVSEQEQRKVVSLINAATGVSGRKAGTWEQLAFFAPRYFTAQLDTIARATKSGADAELARAMLFRTFALGSALVVAVNEARGYDTDFSPVTADADGNLRYNSNFMRFRNIGGADVSPFAGWDSMLGLMTTTAVAGPIEGVERLLLTKASPVASTMWAIAKQRDFQGNDVDITTPEGIMRFTVQRAMASTPFYAQAAMEDARNGDLTPDALFSFFGAKSTPLTLYEQRDVLAQRMFERDWSDLTGAEQGEVEKERPNLFERLDKQTEEKAATGDYKAKARLERQYTDESRVASERALQAQLEAGSVTLDQFDEEMKATQRDAAVAKRAIDHALGIDRDKNGQQNALGAWYDLYDKARLPGTQVIDWEEFDRLEAELMAGLGDRERQMVEERATPLHAEETDWYWDARRLLTDSGYYDTVDSAFEQFVPWVERVAPDVSSYSSLLAAIDSAKQRGDVGEASALEAIQRKIVNTASDQKELMRYGAPELDQALVALGKVRRPVTEQTSRRKPRGGFGAIKL